MLTRPTQPGPPPAPSAPHQLALAVAHHRRPACVALESRPAPAVSSRRASTFMLSCCACTRVCATATSKETGTSLAAPTIAWGSYVLAAEVETWSAILSAT
ncbi:hypothetical protein D9619_001187 [Psilocybe cf. subviscida]|uniref:Uncharacterized protein n=1 Tax=Psilocybe cf. subviscida TaxID=2480587 RepID=A0A8H5F2W2_9AGAR|nr:hypothetical protein D9619_001187 [Psilocybe cf. subviscida]